MVTGALGEEKAAELLRDGAVDYVLKDRMSRLPDAVKRAIHDARSIAEQKMYERKLIERDMLLSQAEALAHLGSWRWEFDENLIYYSEESFNIFGLPPDSLGHEPASFIQQVTFLEDKETIWNEMTSAREGLTKCDCEVRICRPTGEIRWVHGQAKLIRDDAGTPLKLIGTLLDITERKQAKVEMESKLALLQMALEGAQESVWEWDLESGEAKFSPQYFTMLGYLPGEFSANQQEWLSHIHPDDSELVLQTIQEGIAEHQDIIIAEFRMRTKDGRYRWIQGRGKCTDFGADGKPSKMVGINVDIDDRKQMEQKISYLAYHDKLTSLPNRALFFDRFAHALSKAKRDCSHAALLFADLDGFKQVNDEFGHEAGDEILKMAAQRLLACVRAVDTVVRFGGDEFAIILSDLDNPQQAAVVADKLISAFATKMTLSDGAQCSVGVSIGISVFPDHGTVMDGLLSAADQAMYASKSNGKNSYSYFNDEGGNKHVWIKLADSYRIGVSELDEQHSNMVRLVNHLHSAWHGGATQSQQLDIFDELTKATTEHFETEGRYMKEYDYPSQNNHDEEHALLLAEVQRLRVRMEKGEELLVLQTIKDWLLNHILYADKSLGNFLAQQGVK